MVFHQDRAPAQARSPRSFADPVGSQERQGSKFLLTNRLHWEISCILNVYRKRWTGIETFHRDGKHHLGMGDCQLRSGEGQTRQYVPRDADAQSAHWHGCGRAVRLILMGTYLEHVTGNDPDKRDRLIKGLDVFLERDRAR